jgi:hypothetical protein
LPENWQERGRQDLALFPFAETAFLLAQATALGYRLRMSPSMGRFARDLVSVVLALPVALLWIRIIVPILVRSFGILIRPSLAGAREWREDLQRLPPLSNVLVFGVLMVGIGMILATLVKSLVDWRLFGQPWHFISIRDLVYGSILWVIVSVLIVFSKTETKTPD